MGPNPKKSQIKTFIRQFFFSFKSETNAWETNRQITLEQLHNYYLLPIPFPFTSVWRDVIPLNRY